MSQTTGRGSPNRTISWGVLSFGVVACIVGIVGLNWRYYHFFFRERGLLFAAAVLPFQLLFYAYSGVALALGVAGFLKDASHTQDEVTLHELTE